jgi:hypothetical protein
LTDFDVAYNDPVSKAEFTIMACNQDRIFEVAWYSEYMWSEQRTFRVEKWENASMG